MVLVTDPSRKVTLDPTAVTATFVTSTAITTVITAATGIAYIIFVITGASYSSAACIA